MKLSNPFPDGVRNLYLYSYACLMCGSNGNTRGGLELNHIFGRVSSSAYNASVLCHECHSHVGHTQLEHAQLFLLNSKFLAEIGYTATDEDKIFIDAYVIPLYPVINTLWLRYINTGSFLEEETNTEQ
jgi:hypothetical protein